MKGYGRMCSICADMSSVTDAAQNYLSPEMFRSKGSEGTSTLEKVLLSRAIWKERVG